MILALFCAWAVEVGTPVSSVSLDAPRGGLPNESLMSLLRARQGEAYDPQAVRQDITTLLRVGDFAAVEAHTEPWFIPGPDGQPVPAVQLTYRVTPAPRIRRLKVQGNKRFSSERILDAAGLTRGQVFYPTLDAPVAVSRVSDWIRRQGWVNAVVEVDPVEIEPDTYEVWVRVFEGQPNVLRKVEVIGDIPPEVGEETIRRWAREAGVREGKPIASGTINEAAYAIRQKLGRITGTVLRPARGWIGARVNWTVSRDDDGQVDLTVVIEPGPRLDIVVNGLRYRAKRKVRDALGIDERLRLTRGFIDEADERLEANLARRGFYEADAVVELRPSDRIQTLYVEVDRGARFSLRGLPPRRSLAYEGAEGIAERALTRAADQASPDVIRLDRYTDDELGKGIGAMENLYASRGYQQASITLDSLENRPLGNAFTRPLLTFTNGLIDTPPPRRLVPHLRIQEGPQTVNGTLVITGSALPFQDLLSAATSSGSPHDPGAFDRLARAIVQRHREAGYLEATASVSSNTDEGAVTVGIDIEPREIVLLRSIAIRGSRETRPRFIRRELGLKRGQPLTTLDMDRARRTLYGLGIFRSVGIDLLGIGRARDMLITIDERARWGAEVGGGINTDQGARLFARGIRRNLFGVGHRIDVNGWFGINYASDTLTNWTPDLDSLEWRAAVRYTAPHFPSRRTDLVLDVLLQERLQERTWRMARTGAGVTLDTQLSRRTKLSTSLRGELRNLQQYDSRALLPGEPWKAAEDDVGIGLCSLCRLAESIQAVLVHDRRNDPIQPSRGLLASGIAEVSPGVPWQPSALRSSFVKASVRVAGFLPLGKLTLQLSAEGGHVRDFTGGVVPLEDRYRLGGTGSMRGFALQSVGPRNQARTVAVSWPTGIAPILERTEANSPPRWVPTGGDTQGIGIAELLVPWPALGLGGWEGYALAVFADVGNVWQIGPGEPTSNTLEVAPRLRSATGIGIRVATPIGPLQLDVANNNQRSFASPEQRALLRDAWEESPFRAHLSLGTLW